MVELGLILMAIAWARQATLLLHDDKEISAFFMYAYGVGLLLLIIAGFNMGPTFASYLNMAILAFVTLAIIMRKMIR